MSVPDFAGSRRWVTLRPALILYFVLLATGVAVHLLGAVAAVPPPVIATVATLWVAVSVTLFCLRLPQDVAPLLRVRGVTVGRWVETVLVFVALGIVLAIYFAVLQRLGFAPADTLEPFRAYGWPVWSAFVLTAVFPGVFEELAFRGLIQSRLRNVLGGGETVVVQAAMFAVIHVEPIVFPSNFLVGLVLGTVRLRTRSLYPCMVIHMAWNASVVLRDLMADGGGRL